MLTREPINFSTIPEALLELRRGKVVIVVDDDNRENEGDFVGAADKCTPDMINFMATEGRGLICTAITEQRADEIGLKLMVPQGENDSLHTTSFTVSVDFKHGTTTGISTADRAKTVKALADSNITQEDFSRPGHIFSAEGGQRRGVSKGRPHRGDSRSDGTGRHAQGWRAVRDPEGRRLDGEAA